MLYAKTDQADNAVEKMQMQEISLFWEGGKT